MAGAHEWKHYIEFITTVPIDQESLAFFSVRPSAAPYLSDASTLQPIPFATRFVKKDNSDTFFSQTINTDDTISQALALIRKDILRIDPKLGERELQSSSDPDVVLLVHLGSQLNGFQDTIHGGVLASLLDEAFSCCVESLSCCIDLKEQRAFNQRLYTASLNITYRQPVSSPGVYIVEARLGRRDGRKWFLDGRVLGEDGVARVEAKSLWIRAKDKSVL
ncbi:hypothetical protein AARAC_004697 [Aspergillus arachidicola]|uniref:Thioesterase domain-containing protein n=1 Tax=Aspergillus arachidicola TaxID=656916 RepID=A0A2G7G060_9EURO|nr:hypothetical protein AARAC_004697 [Aspergillus arachidicola]